MTTYTKRTNAKRAAIKAGIPEAEVEITVHKSVGEAPRFGFARKVTQAQVSSKAAGMAAAKAARVPREQRNGVLRPRAGGKCAAIWSYVDMHPDARLADVRAWAEKHGHNINNASTEFYRARRFYAAAT